MLQLTFNPGLTLTGFRTTRPGSTSSPKCRRLICSGRADTGGLGNLLRRLKKVVLEDNLVPTVFCQGKGRGNEVGSRSHGKNITEQIAFFYPGPVFDLTETLLYKLLEPTMKTKLQHAQPKGVNYISCLRKLSNLPSPELPFFATLNIGPAGAFPYFKHSRWRPNISQRNTEVSPTYSHTPHSSGPPPW